MKSPEDPTKIVINQDSDIEYWSIKFGISQGDLLRIVKTTGPNVDIIQKRLYLRKILQLISKKDTKQYLKKAIEIISENKIRV